jgi:predicted nucleotidyltransferase
MLDTTRVTELMTAALLREMDEEVDLIIRFGSHVRGNTHAYSDLDLAFVPRDGAPPYAITVMVEETLVDLFPMRWEWLGRMATFDAIQCTVLDRSEILYQREEAAAQRYRALVAEMRARLLPEARPEMVAKALDLFQGTGYPYYLLTEAAAAGHVAACFYHTRRILDTTLHSLGVVNQVCLDTRKQAEVLALPRLPNDFAATLDAVTTAVTPESLVAATDRLLRTTRSLLLQAQAEALRRETSYPAVLDGAYPELKGDLQHVLLAAEREEWFDLKLAYFTHELLIHMATAETGVPFSAFNGLMDYDRDLAARGFPDLTAAVVAGDFAALRRDVPLFDARLGEYLQARGVALNTFDTVDALEAYLRDDS